VISYMLMIVFQKTSFFTVFIKLFFQRISNRLMNCIALMVVTYTILMNIYLCKEINISEVIDCIT